LKQRGISFIGTGSALPSKMLVNQDLGHLVDTNDEWIRSRTGIKTRHLASENESLSDLAFQAGLKALAMAKMDPSELDLIILATSTADDLFGSAAQVQGLLGATGAVAFDLSAACSGFIFALATASQFIRSGVYEKVLIIGADILSRWVDWSDRTTCVLFGDGAGALVCTATEKEDNFLGFDLNTDGTQNHCLNLPYKGKTKYLIHDVSIRQGSYAPIQMNGREVYRFAVAKVPEVIERVLLQVNLTTKDIDWLILHQANQRILEAVAKKLNILDEKVVTNLSHYGNTSAASIPIAFDEAVRKGKIKKGDLIATAGFGAGLSWGGAILKWG